MTSNATPLYLPDQNYSISREHMIFVGYLTYTESGTSICPVIEDFYQHYTMRGRKEKIQLQGKT